jgi:hypothetical protein
MPSWVNVHNLEMIMPPVERSVNSTGSGAKPEVILAEKSTTGVD